VAEIDKTTANGNMQLY